MTLQNKQVAQRATIAHLRASKYFKIVNIFSIGQEQLTPQSKVGPVLTSFKSVANLQFLSMIMCIQNLIKFCRFILKIWSKNQILESMKGRNSVANLRKTTIYNTNIDLVNDDVYTKFGLILLIRSQDIE